MKILHTADWHLGKTINQFSLLQAQEAALDQLLELVAQERPDVVLLAGDIYDRAVPPAEAVALFNRAVTRLVAEMGIPFMAIAGNHDNAERIQYGAQLFEKQGFYVSGTPSFPLAPVVLHDAHGPVYFYLFPYLEPETLRYLLRAQNDPAQINEPTDEPNEQVDNIRTHEDVFRWLVAHIQGQRQPTDRTVLVAHAFVHGGEVSESERNLMVGNAELVGKQVFENLHYTALGHLHKPQDFVQGKVRYAGSPLKYSTSEAQHQKSFTLVEIDQHGQVQIEERHIAPKQNLWVVEGEIIDGKFILHDNENKVKPNDFIHVNLQNSEIQANAMAILQQAYPNTIGLDWVNLPEYNTNSRLSAAEVRSMSEEELVAKFYEEFTQKTLDETKANIINQIIKEIRQNA